MKKRGARGTLVRLDGWVTPTVTSVVGAVLAFAIAVARPASTQFLYDAYTYWVGALSVVRLDNFFEAGGLTLRGAMSTIVYVPAATATGILGDEVSGHAVLVQNAILIAFIGAVLLPRLAALFISTDRTLVIASAVVTAIVLGGFAPYPLMDLWAVTLLLVSVLLAAGSSRWWILAAAGVSAGLAVNLRPAYLVPVVAVAIVWMILYKRAALWWFLGAAASLLPQVLVNLHFARRLLPWPVETSRVVEVQSRYAAFVVRFDGVAYHDAVNPQLFYCSPAMATRVGADLPAGTGDILSVYARTLPESVVLMAQKVASSLLWTPDTPYSDVPTTMLSPLAFVVVTVSVVGLFGLIWSTVGDRSSVRDGRSGGLATGAPLFAVWLGSVATLAYSTAEARFAIPVLLIGIVGSLVVVKRLASGTRAPRTSLVWCAVVVVVVVLLFWVGAAGLSHPAPFGDVTPEICRG